MTLQPGTYSSDVAASQEQAFTAWKERVGKAVVIRSTEPTADRATTLYTFEVRSPVEWAEGIGAPKLGKQDVTPTQDPGYPMPTGPLDDLEKVKGKLRTAAEVGLGLATAWWLFKWLSSKKPSRPDWSNEP